MSITSAKFLKGVVEDDELLNDGTPQIAFIGRSNVGKSSVINTLTNKKDLARTSSFPGRTQEINIFSVSVSGTKNPFYLIDLPGYGYAKGSREMQENLQKLIYWYLLGSEYEQKKVVLIIDANVGMTNNDAEMLYSLDQKNKDVLIVANKTDKIKKSDYKKQLAQIQAVAGTHKVIAYSAEKKIGINELLNAILG